MSVAQIEATADALGHLRGRVVFLGGASIALWITDAASRRPRVTDDDDVVAEVASLTEYAAFQDALRALGFAEDVHSGNLVRWKHAARKIVLDAVPSMERLAGFSDRWLGPAVEAATTVVLPSGLAVRAVTPAWLVVLKLEAFADCGGRDCLSSRDFEDIVLLLDGRESLSEEMLELPDATRAFAASRLRELRALPSFDYGFEGAIGGIDSRSRMDAVTQPRFDQLVERTDVV